MRLKTLAPAVVVFSCLVAHAQGTTAKLPLTTKSAAARTAFRRGMALVENLRTDEALTAFQEAAKQDPNFALAHLFVAYTTTDPAEESAQREQAKALAKKASRGEQLAVRWLTGIRENDFVGGIAAMNDLLARFPRDKQVHFLAGRWLIQQEEYGPGQRILEKALRVDRNYPAALNEIGYAYAYTGDFEKAYRAMERYVKLLPKEPNPQDSFGELSRMGGRFEAALEHYRAALKIDPKFFISQLGLGDTYAVMGEPAKAREEYEKATQIAGSPSDTVDALTQAAISYVREQKLAEADKAFGAVAEKAHAAGLGRREATAHRMMAMYQTDAKQRLRHLDAAEDALGEKHDIAASELEQERARVLRWKASPELLAVRHGKEITAKALAELEKMARSSRDAVVQRQYHGALGLMLAHDGKYAEAIPHLEEDGTSPVSQRALLEAYRKTGDKAGAAALEKKLMGWNEPTLDQALVIPAMRAVLAKGRE